MARPVKTGCDYFPLDCNVDNKIKLLKKNHGLAGYGLFIALLQEIYLNGYFIKIDDDTLDAIEFDNCCDRDFIKTVIDFCIKKSLFDANMYSNYSILTSSGIQKRFIKIKRKNRELIREEFALTEVFVAETRVCAAKTRVSTTSSTQRKVKESKGKERKGDDVETSDFFAYINTIKCDSPSIDDAVKCVYLSNDSFSNVHRMHIENSLAGQPDRSKWYDAISGMAAKYAGVEIKHPNRALQNWLKGRQDSADAVNLDDI